MAYKHRVVQGLAELIERYGGRGQDPIMNAVWWGIKSQVPSLLKNLDESEEAVELIERKMREALGIQEEQQAAEVIEGLVIEAEQEPADTLAVEPEPIEEIKEAAAKVPPKRRRRTEEEKMENVGKIETVEDEVEEPS